MSMSVRRAPMIATSTPCARTQPSPSTASANRATKETASSVRVSYFFWNLNPSTALVFHRKACFFFYFPLKKSSKTQPRKHKNTIFQFVCRDLISSQCYCNFFDALANISNSGQETMKMSVFFSCNVTAMVTHVVLLKCWHGEKLKRDKLHAVYSKGFKTPAATLLDGQERIGLISELVMPIKAWMDLKLFSSIKILLQIRHQILMIMTNWNEENRHTLLLNRQKS